jgi:hypothetical protein
MQTAPDDKKQAFEVQRPLTQQDEIGSYMTTVAINKNIIVHMKNFKFKKAENLKEGGRSMLDMR